MPDFKEVLKVLRREKPSRPVLFEFFLNERLYRAGCGGKYNASGTPLAVMRNMVHAFHAFGYDYATVRGSEYWFHTENERFRDGSKSVSLNEKSAIYDRESFDAYAWMDAAACDYGNLARIESELYPGQKVIVMGPGGVLENVISLMGYDALCMALYDDEQLVYDVFEKVGSGLVSYYEKAAPYASAGALISNDDWGFNTQTMLSAADMRRFVFPWHKKIVDAIHRAGKPAILHSCGNYTQVFDDLKALGYDARHSYEDNIVPVERAYEQFKGKMAVLGGIDVNYLIHASCADIEKRCLAMLEQASAGGYALGSGNSIPDYVPDEKFFAMIGSVKRK
jgi:uroporphyrinogen decarboxylase